MNRSLLLFVFIPIILGYSIPNALDVNQGILVEEYSLGEITTSYENELESIETQSDCISPPRISGTLPAQPGQSFRIIVADPSYCVLTGVILSEFNYTEMQNNIGIFTVKDRTPVTASPTYNYCDLAKWIWDGHTTDYKERVLKTERYNNIFPEYCYQDYPNYTVPEFGTVASLILAGSIVGIIVIAAKTRLNLTPKW